MNLGLRDIEKKKMRTGTCLARCIFNVVVVCVYYIPVDTMYYTCIIYLYYIPVLCTCIMYLYYIPIDTMYNILDYTWSTELRLVSVLRGYIILSLSS